MIGLAAVAAMLAAALLGRSRPALPDRLAAALRTSADREAEALSRPDQSARSVARIAIAALATVAGPLVIGGATGLGVGLGCAAALALVPRRQRPASVNPDDVPVVVDLVAGCLAAGAAMPDALDAAAVAAGDVLRQTCRVVAAALRSGVPPDEAWEAWLGDPALAAVARTAVRTSHTGAAAAEDLRRTSARLRARRRAAAQHRVRSASVWLVVPLGLCFLPAFVLVAVVPLVIGLLPTLR